MCRTETQLCQQVPLTTFSSHEAVTNERQLDAICWSAIESRRRRACSLSTSYAVMGAHRPTGKCRRWDPLELNTRAAPLRRSSSAYLLSGFAGILGLGACLLRVTQMTREYERAPDIGDVELIHGEVAANSTPFARFDSGPAPACRSKHRSRGSTRCARRRGVQLPIRQPGGLPVIPEAGLRPEHGAPSGVGPLRCGLTARHAPVLLSGRSQDWKARAEWRRRRAVPAS